MKKGQKIDFCPFCGNRSPKELISSHTYEEMGYIGTEGHNLGCEYPYLTVDFVAKCLVCEHILIYNIYHVSDKHAPSMPDEKELDMFQNSIRIYPDSDIDKCIPFNIAKIFEEALKIELHSPNMFAVQTRKALEAICVEQGIDKGPLYKRINKLIEQGILPGSLAQASDLLRRIGNVGAHTTQGGVHPLEVNSIKSLFKAIVEYLYVYPRKIEEFSKDYDKYRIWAENLHESQKWYNDS